MLLHLIKKDILIAKKYAILVGIMGIVIPMFIFLRIQEYAASFGFILSIVFSEFMFFQNLFMKESQYSNATALLCSTPYKRSEMILSKYILFVLIFFYCTVVYAIELCLIPEMGKFDIEYILFVFLVISVIYSVYIPIQYQMGYEKTKLFFIVILMGTPFGLPILIANGNWNMSYFVLQSSVVVISGILTASVAIIILSIIASIKIYRKKDLA